MATEDEKIQRIKAENRHTEIVEGQRVQVKTLGDIFDEIKLQNEGQKQNISQFAEALKQLKPPAVTVAAPEVNIELNQENVISSIREIATQIASSQVEITIRQDFIIELLQQLVKPKKTVFTVKKEFDRIIEVIAEQIK